MIIRELVYRFLFLLVTLLLLLLFSNRKKSDCINPIFCIVPICTFLLCVLFSKTQIGLGIGFGLFAIFSILRFRTQSFSIITIIFLFATITISILDCLFPSDKWLFLMGLQITLILVFIICIFFNKDKSQNYSNTFETTIPITDEFDITNLTEIISTSIHKTAFDYTLVSINFVSKQIVVKIFY